MISNIYQEARSLVAFLDPTELTIDRCRYIIVKLNETKRVILFTIASRPEAAGT